MQSLDNLNESTFHVKFLGKYHDITIFWNDNKYDYKPQQIFDQLETITGILSKYTLSVTRHVTQVHGDWHPADVIKNILVYGNTKNSLDGRSLRDGERFHLDIHIFHEAFLVNHMVIEYRLIPIIEVPEGVCSQYVCQHKETEAFLNKIRRLVNDEQFNLEFSQRLQAVDVSLTESRRRQVDMIYIQFNVKQYFKAICDFHCRRRNINQTILYLRTRG